MTVCGAVVAHARMRTLAAAFVASIVALGSGLPAQEKPAEGRSGRQRIVSPEVRPDHTVVFRVQVAQAKSVKVSLTLNAGTHEMKRGDDGIWSATVGPLAPELYHYTLEIDGVRLAEPALAFYQPSGAPGRSLLEIPGDPPLVHEWRDVPHGAVRLHDYWSKSVNHLRHVTVITPPGYESDMAKSFPVLYLLHGAGDRELGWFADGRAHYILDNLLAERKVKPMIVVLPDGYPMPPGSISGPEALPLLEKDLLEDLIPFVEKHYRAKPEPAYRALAGLSMGGAQTGAIGLKHPDRFSWLGCFSGVAPVENIKPALEAPETLNAGLKLLWIGVGKDDALTRARCEAMHEELQKRGIRHEFKVTDGKHEWNVWRKYLAEFLPRLF